MKFGPRLLEMFGLDPANPYPPAEELLRICYPDDRASMKEKMALVGAGLPLHFEHRIVPFDGEVRWLEVFGRQILDDAGRPLRYLGAAYDITERKRAENELRRSQNQLRALSGRLQTSAERERLCIARELHDQLGPELTGMKMDLAWAVRKHGAEGDPWVPVVQDSMKAIDSTIALVRKLATELRPEMLDALGLPAAIEWHSEHFQQRTGIPCTVHLPDDSVYLSNDKEIAAFRIYQEALTNVARHSQAKSVHIALEREQGSVLLTITDDGVGFHPDRLKQTQSLGVLGMRERALLLGADFRIESAPSIGTAIRLRIPLGNECITELEDFEDTDY